MTAYVIVGSPRPLTHIREKGNQIVSYTGRRDLAGLTL
jgi:hypothetical protein